MFETGFIQKAHGIKGEVVYIHESDHPLSENQLLTIQQRSGDLAMVRISRLRPAGNESSFFVLFAGIDNRSDAESLKGLRVFSSQPPPETSSEDDEPDIFSCAGYTITDADSGIQGTVSGITENPAHPIIEAGFGSLRVLIPAADDRKQIQAHNLEALIEFAREELR
jgi:ribosomal 30S subunit maturation factor RimM